MVGNLQDSSSQCYLLFVFAHTEMYQYHTSNGSEDASSFFSSVAGTYCYADGKA